MNVANGRKAMECIKYLCSPKATQDTLESLKYWRQNPTLGDGMKVGNELAMSDEEWNRFKGFMMIDKALNKANIGLTVLKRLNYVSLWTTVRAMIDDGDNKKGLKEVKVRSLATCTNMIGAIDQRRWEGCDKQAMGTYFPCSETMDRLGGAIWREHHLLSSHTERYFLIDLVWR
jgi:hypothetical protein